MKGECSFPGLSKGLPPSLVLVLALASQGLAQDKVNYQDHVLPIFTSRCNSCHNADKKKGDLDLTTFGGAMAGGGSGEVAKPGDAGDSMLWKVVAHLSDPKMPPKQPKLPDVELNVIKGWIEGGLLETAGGKARAASKPKFDLALKAGSGKADLVMPEDLVLEPALRTSRPESIAALAHAPGAPLVAIAAQHQVLLYDTNTLDFLGVLAFPERRAHVLKFSRNGRLLLAGGGRGAGLGKVAVWDVRTGDRVIDVGQEFDAVLAADLSPDQSKVALGGPGKLVKIYSTRDGALLHTIKKHTDWVTALEFSPDGVLLASGDRSGGVHVWESSSANLFYSLNGHKAGVNDVSWRADSNVLATGGEDGQVYLWEMNSGGKVKNWAAHDAVQAARFSGDGRLVTCGRDRLVRAWDGNGTKTRDFEAFGDMAMRAVFTHDGARVVAGDWTGEVRVYATADGKRLGTLSANPAPIADRIAGARKATADAETAHARATADHAAAADVAKKAVDAQTLAEKAAEAAATALKAAETRQAETAQAADVAAKALAAADADLKSRQAEAAGKTAAAKQAVDLQAKAAGELANLQAASAAALKKIQEGLDAAKDLEAAQKAAAEKAGELVKLSEAAQKSKADATAAESAMGPALKAVEERQAAQKAAAEQLAAAQVAVAQAKAAAPQAAQALETAKKSAAASTADAAKAKAALDAGAAALDQARYDLARWTAGEFYLKVDVEKRELAKVQAEADKLSGQAAQARQDADAAAGAVKTAEKAVGDAQAAILKAQEALKTAQAAPEQARAAHEAAKAGLATQQALEKEAAVLAAKLGGPAGAKAQEMLALLKQDVATAHTAVTVKEADIQKAVAAIPVAQQAVATAKAAAEAAAKKVIDLTAAAKKAEEVAAAEKAKSDAYAPTLNAAKGKVEAIRAEYLKIKPKRA
ncbi:MAG TPA: c-type cytochrome domain-containing protein [Planctomycetota bacterium]